MNIKQITDGFETNKPEHLIVAANALFKRLYSTLPKLKMEQMVQVISEEGLALVLTKLSLVHTSRDHNIKLLDILGDPNFLYYAWCILIKNKEQMPRIDEVPIQNVGVRIFNTLSYELLSRKYKPHLAKRIYIKKSNGQERPIGIPTTRDKIVQQALKIIIEPLFESLFSANSHGFRSGRSCHTALHQIKKEWRMVSYFINLNLEKFFEKLGYKQIMVALKQRCNDRDFLVVVYSMLKSGYVSLTNSRDVNMESREGTGQGSIISPLLSNIVLNQFDWIVENKIIPKYNKREKNEHFRTSKEYYNATRIFIIKDYLLRDQLIGELGLTTRQTREIIQSAEVIKKGRTEYSLKDESTERLWYVRYADDFVFGYVGPKSKAIQLTSQIIYELGYFGITVVSEKSVFAHHSKGITFLSYNIFGKYTLISNGELYKNRQRIVQTKVSFSVPIKKLMKRAKEQGFAMPNNLGKVNNKLVARRCDKWIFLQPEEIVRRYRDIIRTLVNYYQGCQQRSDLYEVLWIYKRSCAITLAHQHKFSSYKKVIAKYGEDLTVLYKNNSGKILKVDCKIPILAGGGRFKTKISKDAFPQVIEQVIGLPGRLVPKTLHELKSVGEFMCHIPNCPNRANEWYRVKHRKNSKINTANKQRPVGLFPRQIPLCTKHRILIDSGKYNGPRLNKIKGYNVGD